MERTLVLIKPDAIQRRLTGRILQRFEDKGLKILATKMVVIGREKAEKHYSVHRGKDFFEPLVDFITSGPVIALVLGGIDVISMARTLTGATYGPEAVPGTIRGDFGASRRFTLVHASDSHENASSEIPLFFEESEIIDYELLIEQHEYSVLDREWTGE